MTDRPTTDRPNVFAVLYLARTHGEIAAARAEEAGEVPMIRVAGSDPFPACGFGWVNVKGLRRRDDKLAFASAGFRPDHGRAGQSLWIAAYGQSYGHKRAYARAYAAVLREYGYRATAGSMLD